MFPEYFSLYILAISFVLLQYGLQNKVVTVKGCSCGQVKYLQNLMLKNRLTLRAFIDECLDYIFKEGQA